MKQRVLLTKANADALIAGLEVLKSCSRLKYKIHSLNDGAVIQITINRPTLGAPYPPFIEINPSKITLCGFTGNRTRHLKIVPNCGAAITALALLARKMAGSDNAVFVMPRPVSFKRSSRLYHATSSVE